MLDFVKQIRKKDPGIGGEKLWYMYRCLFGDVYAVGRDRFCHIISKYGLNVRKRPVCVRTTDSTHLYPKYDDLTVSLLPTRANELWVSDITYIVIWLSESAYIFCYLSLLTDAYTKEIIGYCVGDTLESVHCITALKMGFTRLGAAFTPELIHHSDRGVQYASYEYTDALKARKIRISMTQNGNPKDNAVAERVNGIMKNELLKGMRFTNITQVRRAVKAAVNFYNNERPHMSLDMMTPVQAVAMNGVIKKKWKSYREKYLISEMR